MKNNSKPSSKDSQPKVIIKAVTIARVSHLQYRAFELTIEDGVVVGKTVLDRDAGDIPAIQITRCENELWKIRDQDEQLFESITTLRS